MSKNKIPTKERMLKVCLYCDGYNYQCSHYREMQTEQDRCVWDKYIERQLEKIFLFDELKGGTMII